jgi:hypothetical protein
MSGDNGRRHSAPRTRGICRVFFVGVLLASGAQWAPCAVLGPAVAHASTPGVWTPTGSLHQARDHAAATLLQDARLLVAGGVDNGVDLASAEIYDSITGTWTVTTSLDMPRYAATATLLDDGRVLVAGGISSGHHLATAELYDPARATWSPPVTWRRPAPSTPPHS